MNGARWFRNEKLREHQYRELYSRCLKSNKLEWNEDSNVKEIGEQVKQAMVDSARETCGSVKVGKKRTHRMCNGMI